MPKAWSYFVKDSDLKTGSVAIHKSVAMHKEKEIENEAHD